MVDWTRYESIIKTTGETQRERELYKAKQFILRNGRANPSFKRFILMMIQKKDGLQ
ncbi:hypothetical protein SD457_06300 [Coprobacillaceae bacterium CR2/5/TPMF4]|nr:hypothetical protein SD457_06300 [Coprobacillaceae bacterium CR2/5/TPMF4]